MRRSATGNILIAVLALMGALALVGVRSLALESAYPVERMKQTFCQRVWTRVVGFFKGSEACAENVRLHREVASLAMLRADLDRLEAENARLRKALDYRASKPEEWFVAGVLSSGGGAAGVRRVLRVDKGALAGVRKGAVAAVPDGLVGRVTSVTPHTSEITLVTDDSVKVSCEVEVGERGHPRGILCGGDDESLFLRHLTGSAEVPPRARVLTSGLGGIFPKGIEVGTLIAVRKDARGLSCEGEVLPAVDYSTLEDVFIRREK